MRRLIHTITIEDIGKSEIDNKIFEPLGYVQNCDIGKQIWMVNGIYYVENESQKDRRLTLVR
jgi:hypothetical protein